MLTAAQTTAGMFLNHSKESLVDLNPICVALCEQTDWDEAKSRAPVQETCTF
jgi:hypothetical protein